MPTLFTRCSMILIVPALLGTATLPAAATSTKTWVSSTGTDTGACPLTAPCKTFQYAHDQTAAGGEIDVKDTGSYGQVTITKGISIVSGDGALAAVGVPQGGTAITVNAGSQEKVVLEGLVIDGHAIGQNGIVFNSGYSLTVQNCRVRNLTQYAIALQPNGATFFDVANTEVAGAGNSGIFVQPVSSSLEGVISGVSAHASDYAIQVAGSANVSVINSVVTANNYGVTTSAGAAEILLGQSTVSENKTFGIYDKSGSIESYGDNNIDSNGVIANGANVSGTLTSIGKR